MPFTIYNFTESVNTGFVLGKGDSESAAIVLRNMLIKKPSKRKSDTVMLSFATQSAISDYIAGVPRRKSYTSSSGCYFDALVKMGKM